MKIVQGNSTTVLGDTTYIIGAKMIHDSISQKLVQKKSYSISSISVCNSTGSYAIPDL